MTGLTSAKKSFDNGIQIVWDATSLDLAQACARKYFYSMVRGIRPKDLSVHLLFGGLYATALEHFYKHRAAGDTVDQALRKVVAEAMIGSWDYTNGCAKTFDDPKKTRIALLRTIIWYVEQFANETEDGLRTYHLQDGKPAVELSFSLDFAPSIVYNGHLDRVVQMGDELYVMDQKAQPLTANVLTNSGWLPIGQLQLGDAVATQSGEFTPVVGLFPKGVTKVYRVHFNDGSFADCAEDHLWNVGTQFSETFRTVDMTELLHKKPHIKHHVPLCEPVQHQETELPLHPYLLGVLLGDGYFGGHSIQLSSTKDWLVDKARQNLPDGDRLKKASEHNNSWTISGGATLSAIRQLGLKDKLSFDKFVPEQYLVSSIEQRRYLLQGLLDTDGGWNGKHRIFDSTSFRLVTAVKALVRSLGGTARSRNRGDGAWRVSLRLPELPSGVGKRYIIGIERLPDAETMCIKVEHPSGLYLTDNYIVTHNTTGGTIGPYYFNGFSPSNQMSGYSFAGQIILKSPVRGVIIDAAQIAVNFTRFERGITSRSKDQVEEWYESTVSVITAFQHLAESAGDREAAYPMNPTACSNYGGCAFRILCSRSPKVRENFIKSDFTSHNWDPAIPR